MRSRAVSPLFSCLALAFLAAPITARAEPDGGTPVVESTPSPPNSVVTEPVYFVGKRPRAGGPVQASVADEDVARWDVGGTSDPNFVSARASFHAAPRVKVDTTVHGHMPMQSSKKGVLSEIAVLAQTRNHGYWPFRLCFEAGLREDSSLKGKTHVRLMLMRDGHVSTSRVVRTELHSADTAACLASRALALHYAPGPSRRTQIDAIVDLSPGDAPLPDSGSPAFAKTGTAPVEALASAFSPAVSAITACFEDARKSDPGLWGRLALRVDVFGRGAPKHVEQYESRFPSSSVVRCAINIAEKLTFPAPEGGPVSAVFGFRLGARPLPPVIVPGNGLASAGVNTTVAGPQPVRVPVVP
jgi:hypothetical protein